MGRMIGLTAIAVVVTAVCAGDIGVTLDDGRRVILHPDKTWELASAAESRSTLPKDIQLNRLTATGMSKREEMMEAFAAAREEVIKRLSENLLSRLEGSDVDPGRVNECVGAEMEYVEPSKQFSEDGTVKVEVVLEKDNIESILECLR